jgi:hypothetical protein
MNPTSDKAAYQSFLVRLWRDSPESGWRASLEDIATGQRLLFASPDLLAAYLLEQAVGPTTASAKTESNLAQQRSLP